MANNISSIGFVYKSRGRRLGQTIGVLDRRGELDRLVAWLVFLTAVFATASLVILLGSAYLLFFDSNPPAEIGKIELVGESVRPGETAVFLVSLCRFTGAPVVVKVAWVDGGRLVESELVPPRLAPGCYDEIPLKLIVPHTLPGVYRVDLEFEYQINFMKTRSVDYSTDWFLIGE